MKEDYPHALSYAKTEPVIILFFATQRHYMRFNTHLFLHRQLCKSSLLKSMVLISMESQIYREKRNVKK